MTKKEIKCLAQAYQCALDRLNKNFYNNDNAINYFVVYLQYLRDIALATTPFNELKTNFSVSSLCFALNELEEFKNCINKYYKLDNNIVIPIDNSIPTEIIAKNYGEERNLHINNFLGTVRDCYSMWVEHYGNQI